jgi:hypothetical protein
LVISSHFDFGCKDFGLSQEDESGGLKFRKKLAFFLSCEFGGLQPIFSSVRDQGLDNGKKTTEDERE